MGNEHGEWIMYGVQEQDPDCLHTAQELIAYVDEVGFLPLFRNEIPGFSVEEHTQAKYWWSDDPERDPWAWRQSISRSGLVAYGKFFHGRAGYISLKWLPYFANARRDGYDFDARWDDGKAPFREKRLMDLFEEHTELFSCAMKEMGGFGKGGEKNFEGVLTSLQMQTYLAVRDFRQRVNKKGEPYGWAIALYAKPESIWGSDAVCSAYGESPEVSRQRVLAKIAEEFPKATPERLKKAL